VYAPKTHFSAFRVAENVETHQIVRSVLFTTAILSHICCGFAFRGAENM
jgi:hypothetical protein